MPGRDPKRNRHFRLYVDADGATAVAVVCHAFSRGMVRPTVTTKEMIMHEVR